MAAGKGSIRRCLVTSRRLPGTGRDVPVGVDPALPGDTRWHAVDRLPELAFDHGVITLAGRERLRAKLSYTNIGFALAPETFTISELREIYAAALGHPVSATNLQRVLVRRRVLDATGERRFQRDWETSIVVVAVFAERLLVDGLAIFATKLLYL